MNLKKHGGDTVEWNIEVKRLEEQVGDRHEVGNRELEEAQVNNDIAENQLGNPEDKPPNEMKI